MSGIGTVNLKILVVDSDYYALKAVNSYFAWDRRTRVKCLAESFDEMWEYINRTPLAEHPDIIVMDADHAGGPDGLHNIIDQINDKVEDTRVICLAQFVDPDLVETAARTVARGYLLKREVRMQIAWAVVYSLEYDFLVTPTVAKKCAHLVDQRIAHAAVLPRRREFPELTGRIRQTIELCVVEGMPAHLAADEMGISLHTIRGYIKEGYRILEAHDAADYPTDMTPQERAFMRFTAFAEETADEE
jgi:DNA-binding NarL/FixJ family response regulator